MTEREEREKRERGAEPKRIQEELEANQRTTEELCRQKDQGETERKQRKQRKNERELKQRYHETKSVPTSRRNIRGVTSVMRVCTTEEFLIFVSGRAEPRFQFTQLTLNDVRLSFW
jgi:hypothetical protein